MKQVERWYVMLPTGQMVCPACHVVIVEGETVYCGFSGCKAWQAFLAAGERGARRVRYLVDGVEVARFVRRIATPRPPAQVEIDEKMCVLNQAVREIEITRVGQSKDRAKQALEEAYDWLAACGIDFFYDAEIEAFRL